MPTVRYMVMDGEIVSENRNGTVRDYVPDPLGSTIALLDQNQNITDTFSYWPYGEERTRTGTTPTPFRFVGTLGYYRDSSGRTYVRAREYQQAYGRWMTVDELWPLVRSYSYAGNSPYAYVDPSGANSVPIRFAGCKPYQEKLIQNQFDILCNRKRGVSYGSIFANFWHCVDSGCSLGDQYPYSAESAGACFGVVCSQGLVVECSDRNCKERCSWVKRGGDRIVICDKFWGPYSAGCGSLRCLLLHELAHLCGIKGHPKRIFDCLMLIGPDCRIAAEIKNDEDPP